MRLYDMLRGMVESRSKYPMRHGADHWRVNGESVERQMKAALRDGLVTGHYPSGSASAELTDKGRAHVGCIYPACRCVVSTSTSQPEPVCPYGLAKAVGQ